MLKFKRIGKIFLYDGIILQNHFLVEFRRLQQKLFHITQIYRASFYKCIWVCMFLPLFFIHLISSLMLICGCICSCLG